MWTRLQELLKSISVYCFVLVTLGAKFFMLTLLYALVSYFRLLFIYNFGAVMLFGRAVKVVFLTLSFLFCAEAVFGRCFRIQIIKKSLFKSDGGKPSCGTCFPADIDWKQDLINYSVRLDWLAWGTRMRCLPYPRTTNRPKKSRGYSPIFNCYSLPLT